MIRVTWGSRERRSAAAPARVDPRHQPNSLLLDGHPAWESAIAWSARAAPNLRADDRVTYPVAWPALAEVIFTPGRGGSYPVCT